MTAAIRIFAKNYFSSYGGLSRASWRGITINFFESILVGIYFFLPLYFVNDLHFTITAAGLLISFYGIGTIIGAFASGKLSDYLSPGLIATGSLFLQSAAFLILVQLNNFNFLAINLFFMGIASYGFLTACNLWVLKQCDNEPAKIKSISMLNVVSNLGLSISAMIVGSLATYGFKSILMLAGIALLACALYSIKIFTSDQHLEVKKISSKSDLNFKTKNNHIVYIIYACLFLVGFVIFQCNTTYSFYIRDNFPAFGLQGIAWLFTLNTLMVFFLQAWIVNLTQDFNKMLIAGTGIFLVGLGMALLPIANTITLFSAAMFCMIIHTFGEILFFSVAQYICYQQAPEDRKGQALGIYRTIYATSRVVAPTLGAFIYQHFNPSTLWYLCGLIGVLGFLACYQQRALSFH